jgi:hypothetical protein
MNDLNEVRFKDDSINIITDTDNAISDEIYAMFFEQQTMGKQFKIKNFQGETFEEIFEESQSTTEDLNEQPLSETDELKQRIAKLEAMVETLLQEKQNN